MEWVQEKMNVIWKVFVTTLMKEEKELGLKATVTQAEIDDCLERAEEIRKKIEDTEGNEEEYLIYKEEIEEENLTFKNQTSLPK